LGPKLFRELLVSIVDDDPQIGPALSALFRMEGFQTAIATTSEEFRASLERRMPDVAIIALTVGPETGLALLRAVKAKWVATPVIMLTEDQRVEVVVDAMRSGATGVVPKPINHEHLIREVVRAIRENVHISTTDGGRRQIEIRGFSHLTPRERQVLQLICDGRSNKEAGKALRISPRTIEVHRAKIMMKLGAKNTADLMRIVIGSA
jgi:FixJ family two-component response regulator